MWETILNRIKEKIRQGRIILTIHAEEEMDNDDLTLDDVVNAIITGEIIERQRDKIMGKWKYRLQGKTLAADEAEVIVKTGATGKVVIITVYLK